MGESQGESAHTPGEPREFPSDMRGALLSYIHSVSGKRSREIWWRFARAEGYGSVEDFLDHVDRRDGNDAGRALRLRMDGQWDRLLRQSPQHSVTPPDAIERLRFEQRPHLALLAMPDSDFRSALEHGIAAAFEAAELQYDTPDPVRYHVNALFHRRGIPYEVFGTGSLIYRGDEGTRDIVLAPALAALADRRLAGVRAEFEDAVAKLGAGGPKDLEDAIEESRKAVEGTMKVLIDLDPRVQLPRRHMIDDLIRTLVDGGVVESETRPLLEGVSRVANSLASHSAAGEVRNTPRDLAAATVSAAATAIAFLAARLP